MAPKQGTKRASAAAEDPKAKRVTAFLKQQGVSKSQQEAIKEMLFHPLSGLTEECRDMLLAMLPWSVCVLEDERKDFQNKVVGMIEKTAETIQAKMREQIDAESAKLSDQDSRRADLVKGLQDAEAALTEAATAAGERKAELAELSAALAAQQKAVNEAEATEQRENAEFAKAEKQKQDMATVLEGNFKKLKDDDWKLGEETALFKPVKALLGKLDVDKTLTRTLPCSLLKKGRSGFDQIVVDKFEEALRDKIGEASASVEAMRAPAATHTAAAETARTELEAAKTKHQEAEEKCTSAQETSKQAAISVKDAKKALSTFEPQYAKATVARKELTTQLDTFTDYNVCLFRMVANRTAKKQEPAKADTTEDEAARSVAADEQ